MRGLIVIILAIAALIFIGRNAKAAEYCIASWYGYESGTKVACRGLGPFNTDATNPYTLAHKTLACGTMIKVTNLRTGKSIQAMVTDRGPFIAGRCVDLGRAGARALGMGGLASVRVE
jgi:rare lipoprotein A